MNRKKPLIPGILALILAVSLLAPVPAYGVMSTVPRAVSGDALVSSDYFRDEYFRVTTPLDASGSVLVEGKGKVGTYMYCIRLVNRNSQTSSDKYPVTIFVKPDASGSFAVRFSTLKGNQKTPVIVDGKGSLDTVSFPWATRPGYLAVPAMPEGYYNLTIARAKTRSAAEDPDGWYNGPLGGSQGYVYKEALLRIGSGESNNPKVVYYNDVIQNNQAVRDALEPGPLTDPSYSGSYARYRDVYMKDMAFLFVDPVTGKNDPMTYSRVAYLKRIAGLITEGAATDYEKLLKIYEYIGSRIYYDRYAYETGRNQYDNPYRNLYNLRNGVSSPNSVRVSSTYARVATVCQGYASMVIALARASGIPARFVRGHHISLPLETWNQLTGTEVARNTHWWAEAYVDGRWVSVDATTATQNRWTRSSFSSAGTWSYSGLLTYAHFDPSQEQLSNSFVLHSVYPGSKLGRYAAYANEVGQLRTFLETKDSAGVRNGTKLRTGYSPLTLSTWGTGATNNFGTDGYGRVYRISWPGENLTGSLDLSGFSRLKYVSLWTNRLTSIDASGCTALSSLNVKGNRLVSAKFPHNGRTVNVYRKGTGGYFGLYYAKTSTGSKMTIYAASVPGYTYAGIYSSSGKRLTTSTVYSVSPGLTIYYVKYIKN